MDSNCVGARSQSVVAGFPCSIRRSLAALVFARTHRDEKHHQANAGRWLEFWKQLARGTKRFQHPGCVYHKQRARKDAWHHARELVLHLGEMCETGEWEHRGQRAGCRG